MSPEMSVREEMKLISRSLDLHLTLPGKRKKNNEIEIQVAKTGTCRVPNEHLWIRSDDVRLILVKHHPLPSHSLILTSIIIISLLPSKLYLRLRKPTSSVQPTFSNPQVNRTEKPVGSRDGTGEGNRGILFDDLHWEILRLGGPQTRCLFVRGVIKADGGQELRSPVCWQTWQTRWDDRVRRHITWC
jgi:hypothetical protein